MQLDAVRTVVCVVIPCLDEEGPIAGVVREVLEQGVDEVIVVDNGSRDATAARARAAGARVVLGAEARLWLRLRNRCNPPAAGCGDRVLSRWRRQ